MSKDSAVRISSAHYAMRSLSLALFLAICTLPLAAQIEEESLFCIAFPNTCAEALADSEDGRFAPVPEALKGFQVGTVIGVTWDQSKGSSQWNNFYDDLHIFIDYEFNFFALGLSFGVSNQNKYDTETGITAQIVGDHWYDFHEGEGILAFHFDTIALSVGYNVHRDEVHSPYSLLISSRNIPALNAEFEFDNDLFFVTTRWVGLNFDSALPATTDAEGTLPDRGMNYRTFGFQIGDAVRVGYQEAIVYLNQYFNPLYFLAPLPAHFVQIFLTTPGSPFYTEPDPNTVLGVFFEYDDEIHYGYFQFLLDDISVSVTTKISWSLGYAIATDVGRFGIYHAGATRDTFQATRESTIYPYTYVARNTYPTRSGDKTLWYFDNYIGYLYGENALSFQIKYENRFGHLFFEGGVEYVVSGDKSAHQSVACG